MARSTTKGAAAGERPHRVAAFRAAAAHTRLVRTLRLGIPLSTAAIVAAFVGAVLVNQSADADAGHPEVGVTGSSITMESARLRGFDNERRPYEITAKRAEQNIGAPNQVDLSGLAARLQLGADNWAHLVASTGKLDSQNQVLNLDQKIDIRTDDGDEVHLSRAHVQLKEGNIVSDAPVEVKMGTTKLRADGMSISEKGDRLTFQGRVQVILQPSSSPSAENREHPAEVSADATGPRQ
jgi:lipopolysaccharide export system protein LptC